jgi:hypothetical protein
MIRVASEYSTSSAVTGWTACAARIWLSLASETPR